MNEKVRLWGTLGPALIAAACADPLSSVESIDKTRILAAKVEVSGDATRAAPLPGEDVTVSFLVVAPDPAASFAYRFEACVATNAGSELPVCAGDALATNESVEPVTDPPSVTFTTPSDATADTRLAVLGVVCAADTALGDAAGMACADGKGPLAASADFFVDDGSQPNTNPALTSVSLNDALLASETGSTTDCSLLPSIRAGSGQRLLDVELDPASRDALVQVSPSDPTRESLLLSYFVTHGELDHAYSQIDGDAADVSGSVIWTPPPHVAVPTLARFVFVVRDGRGGSDFTERRLCVVP